MKKWFAGSAIFLVIYLIFVLALMPANVVFQWFKLPNSISVQGLSGSIWQAHIEQIQSPYGEINNIDAQLRVLSLFTLDPSIKLTFGNAITRGPEGYATLHNLTNNLSVEDAQITLSANEVIPHLQLPLDISARGDVRLNINSYQLGQPYCQHLMGSISWPKAQVSAMEQNIELGTLSAKLACQKGIIEAVINPQNNLGLTYSAYLQQGGRLSGSGYLKPGNDFPDSMQLLLPLLGQPDAQGRYQLRL